MRARTAGLKMAALARFAWLAYIENEKSLCEWLTLGAAPAWGDALQPGDHLSIGDLNLNRPGVLGTGNECAKLRRDGISHVENAPAPVPEVGDIEIPAAIYFL